MQCVVNFQEAVHNNSISNNDKVESSVVNEETLSLDNSTERLSSMFATYRTYTEDPNCIDDEELTILKDAALMVRNIPSGRFIRQRR